MDPITEKRILQLHPLLRKEVMDNVLFLESTGIFIRIVQSLRTFEEQEKIYNQGRDGNPGDIVTWAKPGFSYHNYGLAFDFCLLHDGKSISWNRDEDLNGDHKPDWMQVVGVFQKLTYSWGGDFPAGKQDFPYLHKTFNLTVHELLRRREAKQLDDFGYVII